MSSFGEDLRRERELRRITLREVAESTKITLRYLEALERNDFDQLPGGVFNRGFVRAYAEFIGVDPESMVTAYLLEVQTRSSSDVDSSKGNSGAVLRGDRMRGGDPTSATTVSLGGMPPWSKWLLALIALTILVLGGLYLVRRMSGGPGEAAPVSSVPTDRDPAGRPEPQPVATSPSSPATGAEPDADTRGDDDRTAPERSVTSPAAPTAAIIHVDRATSGRVNCDNRQIETLDGARGGTQLRLDCSRFLIFDAADAGALRLTLAGGAARPLGKDGDALVGYRVDLTAAETGPTAAKQ